jgi:hypothetical protein
MLTPIFLFALLRAESGLQEQPWDFQNDPSDEPAPEVFRATAKQAQDCSHPGSICFSPGGSATSQGYEMREGVAPITVLARGAQVAAVGAMQKVAPSQSWQVQMVASFARRSSGTVPLLIAVMDGEDPEALERHEAVVIWDVTMKAGSTLGMRFLLSPEQGLRPSHDYRLRVVQADRKAERILAEGAFRLE